MKQAYTYNHLVCFYNRSRRKLQNLINEGKNFRKQNILKRRILKLFKELIDLQKVLRTGMATAALSAGMLLFQPNAAQAQITFDGEATPPGLTDIGSWSSPTFVDLDNDGDMDVMSKEGEFFFKYLENTGTSDIPAFAEALTNPFGLVGTFGRIAPCFADMDNDGDMDLMAGDNSGNFYYFENTGTATVPAFAGSLLNPFGLTDIGSKSAPALIDIDTDGDIDLMSGESGGNFKYFENIGTEEVPSFAAVVTNPFELTVIGGCCSAPTFADLDNDGDMDLMSGETVYYYESNFYFFENTGTDVFPAFADFLTNPFGLTALFSFTYSTSNAAFADLDNDGDKDLMSGSYNGYFIYFKNVTLVGSCEGTPDPGATLAPEVICTGTSFTVSVNETTTEGVTYAWEKSNNAITWTAFGTSSYNQTVTQIANKYYRCTVSCSESGESTTSTPAYVAISPPTDCYCIPYAGISYGNISNVSFGTYSNTTGSAEAPYYTAYIDTSIGIVSSGLTYTLSATTGLSGTNLHSWIDYNQNGNFEDAGEYIGGSPGLGSYDTYNFSFTVPEDVLEGETRVRILIEQFTPSSCESSGETEDYMITIDNTPCAGTPVTSTIIAPAEVCTGSSFNLSVTEMAGTGVSYTWENSIDGSTWSAFGTNGYSQTTSQTETTFYRSTVSCSESGESTTSTAVVVAMSPDDDCYCTPEYTTGPSFGQYISDVSFGIYSNLTGAATTWPYYTFYSDTSIGNIAAGPTYTLSVTSGSYSYYNTYLFSWIDFNQNGSFEDAGEFLGTSPALSDFETHEFTFTVPFESPGGETRLRVRSVYGYTTTTTACNTISSGEAEDYLITINSSEPSECPTSSSFTSFPLTVQAGLKWSHVADAVKYRVRFKPVGTVDWEYDYASGTKNYVVLKDLSCSTQYEWAVITICATDGSITSGYSASSFFTTGACRLAGDLENVSINFYPNPASTEININPALFTDDENITIEMYDMTGRKIKSFNINEQQTFTLDVSDLNAGVYMLKILNAHVKASEKIVIE